MPFLLFWRVWWPDADVRQVFAFGDFLEQHYPMRVFVARELRAGRLPLWDPYTFAGQPAAAVSIFGAFYPLGLWEVIWPRLPFLALELEAIAHLSLGGVFAFLLVRDLTGRDDAGFLSGMSFALGGYLTSYPLLQMVIVETAAWLPVALWLLERGFRRRSLLYVAGAGAALGVSYLAGHPQTFLYMAYLTGAYLIFRSLSLRKGSCANARMAPPPTDHGSRITTGHASPHGSRITDRFPSGIVFPAKAALLLGGVALALSSPALVATAELARLTGRQVQGYEALSGGFALNELWGMLRPNSGQWSPLYVGLVPLALAVAAPILRRRADVWFWAGAALVALLLALGRHGFLYPLAYRFLPGFALFRQQERSALVVSLALAVLAGYGYAALRAWRWWPQGLWLPGALCAIVLVDLYHANGRAILQPQPAEWWAAPTPAVERLLAENDGVGRVSGEGLLPADGNGGLLFALRDTCGNGPLPLASYQALIEKVPELRWWQLLNVHHVLTRRHIDHGALWTLVDDPVRDQRLYAVSLGQRAAWICHSYQLAADQSDAFRLTADMNLNPMEAVVLEQAPPIEPQLPSGQEEARVVVLGPQAVVVEANLSAPGVLVLSEMEYPGWSLHVDGGPAQPLRAFGALRAVALSAGKHHIEWRYQPLAILAATALSTAVLLSLAALAAGRALTIRIWARFHIVLLLFGLQ